MEKERQEVPEKESEELTHQQVEERLKEAVKNKGGAPRGNQNARTHGFYSKVLPASERKRYEETVLIDGLDEEIAVLRIKFKSLVRCKPADIGLITRTANALTRMINARNKVAAIAKAGAADAVLSVLNEIALPAGISLTDFFKK